MKSKITKILLFLALILLPLSATHAADTRTGDSIYIAKDEIVSGNLYVAGNVITIDGDLSGDLIAAAQTINVNGRVEGDIIAVAQDININGEVGGNIRMAGNSIVLNGPVARNVMTFGANTVLGTNSNIGWDFYTASGNLEARGNIDGNLSGNLERALLSGKTGKNVNLKMSGRNNADSLFISPESSITGDLKYSSKNPAKISEQATISGKIEHQDPVIKNTNHFLDWAWSRLFAIFSALVVGLILIFLGKKITPKIIKKIEDEPLKTILPGLIIMFILPPLSLILLFTIIGIPLALIIMAWWLTALYISKIFGALFIGQIILKKLNKNNEQPLIWQLILGVMICYLLFSIPFIGWVISLIITWIGLGGAYLYASHQLRNL